MQRVINKAPRPPPSLPVAAQDRWYGEKLGVGPARRRSVVEAYISGLHWVLEYYYRGVASWNWFYPHHYAPCASDFVSLDDITGGCLHACMGVRFWQTRMCRE